MNSDVVLLCAAVLLVGCGSADQKAASHATAASVINAECKAGQRTGSDCEAAGRAVTKTQHEEAASAFRNMAGTP